MAAVALPGCRRRHPQGTCGKSAKNRLRLLTLALFPLHRQHMPPQIQTNKLVAMLQYQAILAQHQAILAHNNTKLHDHLQKSLFAGRAAR